MIAYHLHFSTPLHIGIEAIGQEKIEHQVRSDTLFGAIIACWLMLFEDDPDSLCQEPPFEISSCFPLIKGKRFYPVPIGSLDSLMDEAANRPAGQEPTVKTIKKIKFIEESFFQKICNGGKLQLDDLNPSLVFPFEIHENYNIRVLRYSSEHQRPRIRTDQASGGVGENSFFYCSDQFFHKGSGQFFLAKFKDEEAKKRFEAALLLLGDTGIGADRSVGRGLFKYSIHTINLSEDNGSGVVLMSLCLPSEKDVKSGLLSHPQSSYNLVRRFGRAGTYSVNRYRRPDCWMLSEGSIFTFAPEGKIVSLIKKNHEISHNVYRYGKAFCLPFSAS